MNREIIFRGKRIDNGEWFFGDLVRSWIQTSKDNGRLITEIKSQYVDEKGEMWNEHEDVIPSTVGQYTGLTDKNGTKIFEGDEIRFLYGCFYPTTARGFVGFYHGAFGVTDKNGKSLTTALYEIRDIEVIGNVWDGDKNDET